MTRYFGLTLLLLWMMMIPACTCQRTEAVESMYLSEILGPASGTGLFRGVNLGDPLSRVLEAEQPRTPAHHDKIGIFYLIPLSGNGSLELEYYADYLRTGRPSDRVVSIVANIVLEDEVETARLYGEILSWCSARYGVPGGVSGDYSWESPRRLNPDMEVRLRLDSKKGITLNFIDTQPDTPAEAP
ncbi:MAG: hypothetical protein SF053_01720 [Bacteroidia bacterium]|nr:hypothetical protein [Bacteroidia bacterium]